MNASTNNARPVTPVATTFACAGALLNAAQVLLRRLGFTEVGNDALSCVVADLSRIESVLIGRANGAQHGAPAPVVAPSPAVSMPPFVHPDLADEVYSAMTAPVALPVDPVAPDDDDEFDGPNTVECDDDVPTDRAAEFAPALCASCKGKGSLFGKPCGKCRPVACGVPVTHSPTVEQIHNAAVPTVAANKPVAAPALTTDDTGDDDVPIIGYDDVPEGYAIRVQAPIMRTGKPLHVVEFDDVQLYDDYSPTKALAFAQKHAIDTGRARRAPKPAPTPMSQKPVAQPVLRQGNSSEPLNPAAPAPKASAPAAPSPVKPAGKPTPVAPAPNVVAPLANANGAVGVNTDHVNRATEALDKGSIKALALACAVIGLPAKASDGAKVMREALADWLLANDDVDTDDEQGSEPVAAVAPAPVAASKPAPVIKPAAPKAPAPKPVASKAPKTVDTSSTGGLPLNMWRMLLAVDAADGAPLTYAEIRDMLISEFGINYYSGMTAALREAKPDSLSDRGLVAESLVDVDGRSKFAFTITAQGRALVAKHS